MTNVILGASSLYWHLLKDINPLTLLASRVFFPLLTLSVLLILLGRFRSLLKSISIKILVLHGSIAGLLVINWELLIWASISGHVLESGLGYLIAPFVSIGVGAAVFKDYISGLKKKIFLVIIISVCFLLFIGGELNYLIYLGIGITWGGYACLKKQVT